ncbi:MAG TPA: hypothetical protein VGL81_09005 [Polyangiaceae bacterium]|jgi:hypothetical protein
MPDARLRIDFSPVAGNLRGFWVVIEKCSTTADCCGASQGFQCINGFCATPGSQ